MSDQKSGNEPWELSRIEKLVRDFESCRLPLDDFNHREHLAVTLFYLTEMPLPEATERMRRGLHRFTGHYGVSGYNETITLFWMRLVARFLAESGEGRGIAELLRELNEKYGSSRLIFDHYSRELLMSEGAKAEWTPPDLKELDF